jgi:anaerobic nitric oxide reductase flavorubredoxin
MKAVAISPNVWALHVDIKSDDLFEGIWPIPTGVSLNSYLVKGDKIALIDLVRDWVEAPAVLAEELSGVGIKLSDIDYLILNHMEPDHTGWLSEFKALAPKAEILATEKALPLIRDFYKIESGARAGHSGDKLDLGGGKTLAFEEAPNVHWPETMVTYAVEDEILFSCDAFGSFGSLGDRVFDDEFSVPEHAEFERESLRYYANIVASFSTFVDRAIQKISALSIKVVAPSHGIVWRKDPLEIVKRYSRYARYAGGLTAEKEICVVWGSMYGNTESGLKAVLEGIAEEGVPYSIHRVPDEDVSYILADAYKSKGIVIAMPTYEYQMFPPMAYALDIFKRKHVQNRLAFRCGSFGWVGGAKKEYDLAAAALKWNSLESVEWAGKAGPEALAQLKARGKELALAVKAD